MYCVLAELPDWHCLAWWRWQVWLGVRMDYTWKISFAFVLLDSLVYADNEEKRCYSSMVVKLLFNKMFLWQLVYLWKDYIPTLVERFLLRSTWLLNAYSRQTTDNEGKRCYSSSSSLILDNLCTFNGFMASCNYKMTEISYQINYLSSFNITLKINSTEIDNLFSDVWRLIFSFSVQILTKYYQE